MNDSVTNEQKAAVWDAYRKRQPTRVPVTFGINPRVVLLDPDWNPRGVTFEEYFYNAAATIEIQQAFMRYQREYLNHYCDQPLGWPTEWTFYLDRQNVYDAAYFGAPIRFRDGQVPTTAPILGGAAKEALFGFDLEHPLDNPFVSRSLQLHAALTAAVRALPADGIQYKVAPLSFTFDGPLTVATNLRGGEILTDLYEDPDYVRRLFGFIQRAVEIRNRALTGLTGQNYFAGAIGGLADDSIQLISKEMYRNMVLPFHRAWLALWQGPGPHGMHLCGDATRHFPTIHQELNVCSFDTGFPVDHGALRRELGPDVEIMGGPEVALLINGTPAQVYARTRAILLSGIKDGGRFILREGNNLPPRVPAANLAALYRAGLEHGQLP